MSRKRFLKMNSKNGIFLRKYVDGSLLRVIGFTV